jgi:hypothetical protein
VPLTVLFWWDHPLAGLTLGIITLSAAALGISHTQRVRERGGVEAQRERERPGITRLAVGWIEAARAKRDRIRGERLAVGISHSRQVVFVPLGRRQGRHGLILGATGSGKTVTEAALAQAHLRARNAVVAVDPKGDDFLYDTLAREAGRQRVPVKVFTPTGPSVYNVAARGGRSEVADKLLSAHEWSEPHYLAVAFRFLQREIEVLVAAGVELSLGSISHYLHPERLEVLAEGLGDAWVEDVQTLTDDMPRRMLDDLAGARSRIALLAESEFGRWLSPSEDGDPELDLEEVIRCGGVAYLRLEADRYPELARLLAAALTVDLIGLSAHFQGGGFRAALVIDEFAMIAPHQVARLFATARTAGLSTILATQGLADLRAAREDGGADSLTGQVLQNLEFLISHRQSDPESAERLAQLAGTHADWTVTRKVEGFPFPAAGEVGSRIPTRSFHVHPDQFKGLADGEAVVMELGRAESATVARIWPPEVEG